MFKRLNYIKQNLTIAIPIAMVLGVFFGYLYTASFLKILILPLTILMIYPMMVTLDIKKVFSTCCLKTQFMIVAINFLIIPFIGFFIGKLFLTNSPLLAYGLLLMALLPTSGMTISWTGFAKGNVDIAIRTTAIGLLVGSLLMPFYTKFLMGKVIDISLIEVFSQLGKVILIPLLLGFLTQLILKKYYGAAHFNKNIKKKFPLLSTLAVVGIIFVAMALKSNAIIKNPLQILYLLIPLSIFYVVNYSFSTFIGKTFLPRAKSISLVFGTVMRNLSVALAIALAVFGEKGTEIALIVAVGYIIQVQSAAWYIKIANKIFGAAPLDTAKDIMEEGIFALHNNSTLHDAVKLLDEEHIHSLMVLSKTEQPLGLITSKLVINALADNTALNTQLSSIKLHPIIKMKEQASISTVLSKMKRKHKYKVALTNNSGELTGILTESDIIDLYANRK
ncbi:MAG: CBS domain-containing protein [Nanoarchaeota archaeon]|nr:CBS domain-containing protein [Nanoarchaeota archaeon]